MPSRLVCCRAAIVCCRAAIVCCRAAISARAENLLVRWEALREGGGLARKEEATQEGGREGGRRGGRERGREKSTWPTVSKMASIILRFSSRIWISIIIIIISAIFIFSFYCCSCYHHHEQQQQHGTAILLKVFGNTGISRQMARAAPKPRRHLLTRHRFHSFPRNPQTRRKIFAAPPARAAPKPRRHLLTRTQSFPPTHERTFRFRSRAAERQSLLAGIGCRHPAILRIARPQKNMPRKKREYIAQYSSMQCNVEYTLYICVFGCPPWGGRCASPRPTII